MPTRIRLCHYKWIYEAPYIALAVLLIYFLTIHSPNLDYDALSYIDFDSTRPPLYPVFLGLFHWAGAYQFELVIWVQGIFLFVTLLYARHWLRKNLQLSDFSVFLICLFVLFTISFHYQVWYVGSEGLSFPLFIWTFFLLIECFQKFSLKKLTYLALWVALLVLTRLQFYYFYIIFGILCLWYLWKRIPAKLIAITALILFGSMLLTLLMDRTYHYVKHGFFSGAPYGGFIVMVQPFYLADNHAADYFQNPIEKTYVQTMINQRNAQSLNQDAHLVGTLKPSYYQLAYQTYARNYIALLQIIMSTLHTSTSLENAHGNITHFYANEIATNIDNMLISHEFRKNVLFFLWKFIIYTGFGSLPVFVFFSILLFAILFKILIEKNRDPGLAPLFVIITIIITFLNAAIIAVCNPDLPPYFCYSQFTFYCLAGLLASRVFPQRDNT